jgi:hypothetical protein
MKIFELVKCGLFWLVAILVCADVGALILQTPIVAVDWYFYKRLVIAPLNIVLYNVLSSNTSSQLYGACEVALRMLI